MTEGGRSGPGDGLPPRARLLSRSELFPPRFLARSESLASRGVAAQGSAGAHATRAVGAAAGFSTYRSYAPGDDLRRVDWRAFARLGEPFVRLGERERDQRWVLLLDESASMGFGAPLAKRCAAARLAAVLAHAALRAGDAVCLGRLSNGSAQLGAPVRGPDASLDLLDVLGAGRATGTASPTPAARDVAERFGATGGAVVCLSDGWDAGWPEAVRTLRLAGFTASFLQVLDPLEVDPAPSGRAARVADAEAGDGHVDLTLDVDTAASYRRELASWSAEFEAALRASEAPLARVLTTDDPVAVVAQLLAHRAV